MRNIPTYPTSYIQKRKELISVALSAEIPHLENITKGQKNKNKNKRQTGQGNI